MPDYEQVQREALIVEKRPLNIAILTHNALDSTRLCLESISRHTSTAHNIFILDNLSSDETPRWLEQCEAPNLFYSLSKVNTGVPGGRNALLEMIEPYLLPDAFVVFLDNDMEVLPHWDSIAMAFFADHPQAGIASAFGHRMIVHHGGRELLPAPKLTEEVDVACGGFACFMRATTIRATGAFDQNLGLFWHEDDDYSVRAIQNGFSVYALPHLPVIHHEHKSGYDTEEKRRVEDGSHANQRYLVDKWRAMGAVDWSGRIRRRWDPVPNLDEREILPGLRAKGLDRDGGGRFLLLASSEFTIAQPSVGAGATFSMDLRCGARPWYNLFPFKVKFFLNGSLWTEVFFSSTDQIQHVEISIPASEREVVISIESEGFYVPLLCNNSQIDSRAVFGHAGNISISPASVAVQFLSPPTDDSEHLQRACSTEGLLFIAPLLESGEEGAYCRALLESMPDELPLQAVIQNLEERPLWELRQDPLRLQLWQKRLSTRLTRGSAVIAFPSFPSADPEFFARFRQKYPQISRWTALLNPQELRLPEWYARTCRDLDAVWVLSATVREALCNAGVAADKISLRPPAPNFRSFSSELTAAAADYQKAQYTFFSVFDWRNEQAWDVLLQSYFQTFRPSENVCLLIRSSALPAELARGMIDGYLDAMGLTRAEAARIEVVDDSISESSLAALMRTADCYVQIDRTPGTGYFRTQAMLMGLPVICGAWNLPASSGNPDEGLLIQNFEKIPAARDSSAACRPPSSTFWHEPSHEELSRALRSSFDSRETPALKAIATQKRLRQAETISPDAEWLLAFCALREKARHPEPEIQSCSETVIKVRDRRDHNRFCIGIDARTLTYPETSQRGIGHYTCNHLAAIMQLEPDWHFVYYLHERADDEGLHSLLKSPNTEWRRFEDRRFDDLDLMHLPDLMSIMPGYDSPYNLIPRGLPTSVVMYDFIPIALPDCHFSQWHHSRRFAYKARLQQLKESDSLILAISEHTRQDLQRFAEIDPARAVNIQAGLNTAMKHELPTPDSVRRTLDGLGVKGPFFMTVGGLDAHKGFAVTANAYVHICKAAPMHLVVVGSENDPYKEVYKSEFDRLGCPGVIFTGYLSREELQCLYASATALVFPSRYEGFGLPVLEAMAHGCPVITSNATSLPEVAGDAAIMINPEDTPAAANAMARLLQDPSLRQSLREKGLQQSARFTWPDVASRTLSAWQQHILSDRAQAL